MSQQRATPLSRKASISLPPSKVEASATPRRGTLSARSPRAAQSPQTFGSTTSSHFQVELPASERRRTSLITLLKASTASTAEIRDAERRVHTAVAMQALRHEKSLNIGCGRGLTQQELTEATNAWNRIIAGHETVSGDELLAMRRQTVSSSETILSMMASLNVRLYDFVVDHVRRTFSGELNGKANISDFLRLLAETKVLVESAFKRNPLMSDDFIDVFMAVGGNKDGSGSVDASRVASIVERYNVTCDVHSWLADGDADGDNQIDFSEFCEAFALTNSTPATFDSPSDQPLIEQKKRLASISKPPAETERLNMRRSSHAVASFSNTQTSAQLGQTSSSVVTADTPTRLLVRLQQITDPSIKAQSKPHRRTTVAAPTDAPDPQVESYAGRSRKPSDTTVNHPDVIFGRERAHLSATSQQLVSRSSWERKRREAAEQLRGGHLQLDFDSCTLNDITKVVQVPQSDTMKAIANVINSTASRSVPTFRKQLSKTLNRRGRSPQTPKDEDEASLTPPPEAARSPRHAIPAPPRGPGVPTPKGRIAVYSTVDFTLKSEEESRAFRERRARDESDAALDRQDGMPSDETNDDASPDGAASSDDDEETQNDDSLRKELSKPSDTAASVYLTSGGHMVRKSVVPAPKSSLHRDDSMVIDLKLVASKASRAANPPPRSTAPPVTFSPRTLSARAAIATEMASSIPAVVLDTPPALPPSQVQVVTHVRPSQSTQGSSPRRKLAAPTTTNTREPVERVGSLDDRLQTWYYGSPASRPTPPSKSEATAAEATNQAAAEAVAPAAVRSRDAVGEAGFLLVPPSALLL